jgi:colicin import membrane protein
MTREPRPHVPIDTSMSAATATAATPVTPATGGSGRDPFVPGRPRGGRPALALALFAHALLIGALAFGVHWRNTEPTRAAAELWSAVPQAAAPRAAEPLPAAPPPPPARPTPAPAPPTVAPPKPAPAEPTPAPKAPVAEPPDPQIAIEQARRTAAAKREAADERKRERADEAERARVAKTRADQQAKAERAAQQARAQEIEQQQQQQQQQRKKKTDAEQARLAQTQQAERAEKAAKAERAEQADAAKQEAIRQANVKRMLGMAGATGGATDSGTALRASGPSASYAGRIMARIKPNILFTDPLEGNPVATVEVKLAPDGTIVAKRLVKSSTVKSWDDAVLRAVERTGMLPLDVDGRVPPPFEISFRLRD